MTKGYLVALLVVSASAAGAQMINSVAVSPDGGTVLVGGDNRTLYTIDTANMQVTDRRWIADTAEEIAFGNAGALIYVRDGEQNLTAYDAATMAPAWHLSRVSAMQYLPEPGLIVALESRYDGSALTVVDATTGVQARRIDLGELEVDIFAALPDGSRAMALTDSDRTENEPREDEPKDLEGVAKYAFRQQHDGYASQIVSVDLVAGAVAAAETYYRVIFPNDVRVMEDHLVLLNGNSDSARIAADGTTELIDMGDEYFSMAVTSAKGDEIIFTDGQEVSFRPVDPTQPSTAPLLDAGRIGGGAERATAVAEGADGTLYLGTSAYRLLKVPADRSGITAHPVY